MGYLIKSRLYPEFVIPAKARILLNQLVLGTGPRESDGLSVFF
jgi:hypothetical protein